MTSLMSRDTALICGQVIQAALPDTSFYLDEEEAGGTILWVHLPEDEKYPPLLSFLEAGRFIRERLTL